MPLYLYGLLLVLSLIWGGSFFFIKILLDSFNPVSVAFLRCLFGALVLLIIILARRESFQLKKLPWIPLIVVGLLNSAVPWTLLAYSETKISSSFASVLNASTPIWTLLIGIIIFRLSTTLYQWIGIGLGFIGILVLIDIDWSSFYVQDSWAVLTMVLVTMCYGYSSQLSKRSLDDVSVYQLSFITISIGTVFSGSFALFTETNSWLQVFEIHTLLALFGLGVLGSGIAYIIFFQLIQKGSAEFATLVTYLVPPFAIIWGVLLLNEPLSSTLIIGLLIIFTGVFISSRKKKIQNCEQPTVPKQQVT